MVWKSCLDIFVSLSTVCLNYLEMISSNSVCLNSFGIVKILPSCGLARLEFAVLVIFDFRLGSKLPVHISVFILFSRSFLFLADAVLFFFFFCFLRTLCCFCSCFVLSNPICWHLKLLARALVLVVCFLSI